MSQRYFDVLKNKAFACFFMRNYGLPTTPQDLLPEASQKLTAWRLEQGYSSQRSLSDEIRRRIEAAYAPDSVPPKTMVSQPDLSKAEQGFPGPFKKVVLALQKYFGVPENYFGHLAPASPQERLSAVREQTAVYQRTVDSEFRSLQSKLIEQLELIVSLQEQNKSLHLENLDLQRQVESLKSPQG